MIQIFDGGYETQGKAEFSACRIPLAATLHDLLDWKQAYGLADNAIARGQKIFWDLDMGLFSRLPLPLSDEGQFRACALAVESLLQVIKERFSETTLGVCLYRGYGDMRRGFPWEPGFVPILSEEDTLIECRNRCWDFLHQLVVNWPDTIPLFTLLDLRRLKPLTQLTLLHREVVGRFCPIVRGISLSWQFPHLGWEEYAQEGTLSRQPLTASIEQLALDALRVTQGLLVPSLPIENDSQALWESVLLYIEQNHLKVRILTESLLTAEWDGLDRIIIPDQPISSFAERALQGFMAAGGEVISLQQFLEMQLIPSPT